MAAIIQQQPTYGGSSNQATSNEALTLRINITHELDRYNTALPTESELVVPPSRNATKVIARSTVVSNSALSLRSPAYIASVRNRRILGIIKNINLLADYVDRDDFVAATFPISEEFHKLLQVTLVDADEEGNTREILRRVRDTFLNGGHESYRDPKTRETAILVLSKITRKEQVTSEDVADAIDTLRSNGVKPLVGIGLFRVGNVDEEEDQVLD